MAEDRADRYTKRVRTPRSRKKLLSALLLALAAFAPCAPAQLPEAAALTAKSRANYPVAQAEFARLLTATVGTATADRDAAALAEYCATMMVRLTSEGGFAAGLDAIDAARSAPLARAVPALRARLGSLLLQARRQHGGDVAALAAELGVLRPAWVCGPFDNERGSGYATAYAPESAFEPGETYDGKLRPVAWRQLQTVPVDGNLPLGEVLRPNTQVVAYVATALLADAACDAALWLGSSGAVRVFCNGVEVFARDVERELYDDQDHAVLPLQPGPNLLVVKACDQEGAGFGLRLRIAALDGAPLPGVRSSDAEADLVAGSAAEPRDAATGAQADANARDVYAAAADGSALAAMRLCAILTHTHVDGDREPRPRQLAEQAAVGLPDVAEAAFLRFWTRPRLAGKADRDDNPQRRDLAEVLRRDPQHVEARLLLASLELSGSDLPTRAEAVLQEALAIEPQSAVARLVRSYALQRRGLEALAEAERRRLAALPVASQDTLRTLLQQCNRNGELDQAAAIAARLAAESTAPEDQIAVARLWLRLGRRDDGVQLLQRSAAHWPLTRAPRSVLAELLAAEGDLAGALQVWSDWLQLCPEDDQALLAVASLHAQRGDRERQTEVLRAAIDFNPNLAAERRHLEWLTRDEVPFHQPYELDTDAVIAADAGPPADAAASQDPLHHLLRQRVVKAFANGTTSEYVHVITRVLSEEGARRFTQWRLPHRSGAQRARILSCTVRHEDGSVEHPRLQGATVAIGSLQPGDTVAIRGRIDDLAPTFFGAYFGLEHTFPSLDGAPLARSLLTVIAAGGRDYRWQAANGAPDATIAALDGGDTRYDWEMRSLPRDEPEIARPDVDEFEPLVRMTTYRDWDQFASWWWHLIEKQIDVTPAMRDKVRELCATATTPAERVDALYRFVTTDVRYEAWEFGVHGYKPYNTSVIFERRHGDCKDKALLLCALLREVDIVARPVLIFADPLRTRDDLSLALVQHFNHAIAWLPAQEGLAARFLDGTAVLHPSDTLPEMDQGARVLIVNPDRSELADVPWTTPAANRDERELTIDLRADGSATVALAQRPRGNAAVGLRQQLVEAPATLREQLERQLLQRFGKSRIDSVTPSDGNDLATPASLSITFAADELAQRQGRGLQFATGFDSRRLLQLSAAPERTTPLLLGVPSGDHEVLRIAVPKGLRPGPLPRAVRLEQPFAAFRLEWSQQGDRIVVERELQLRVPRIEPADYAAFRGFAAAVQDADAARLVLEPQENR
ncbi:MAG: DUF3857 domain-containing protein [Planctomycetes bacterium]|nr:DUF3857 domain-containing protein [Planctomycetota bacterium]